MYDNTATITKISWEFHFVSHKHTHTHIQYEHMFLVFENKVSKVQSQKLTSNFPRIPMFLEISPHSSLIKYNRIFGIFVSSLFLLGYCVTKLLVIYLKDVRSFDLGSSEATTIRLGKNCNGHLNA